jgi:CxxC motif-containing protein (DUF1111 family)
MLCSRSVWRAAAIIVWAAGVVVADEPSPQSVELGRDLFSHEWAPNDPKSHGGDGLGPVYNDTSCVACHSQGGQGGAGAYEKNVLLMTALLKPQVARAQAARHPSHHGGPLPDVRDPGLVRFHAGFRDGPTVVLHRHGADTRRQLRELLILRESGLVTTTGTSPAQPTMMQALKALGSLASEGFMTDILSGDVQMTQAFRDIRSHTLSLAERNPPPLFGLGRIDELSESDLEKNAAHEAPSVRGRLHHIKRGVISKFGWKGQIGTLDEFVHVACAGELGLEVPGHHQAATPDGPVRTGGLDLNQDECKAMTAYIASLPSPTRAPGSETDSNVQAGERLFQGAGCTKCHSASVGALSGLYSDLLLHDLGKPLGDGGAYSGSGQVGERDPRAARPSEWRTPPLWGYRDSVPYLHDGRAQNLDEAVKLHHGQGDQSRQAYLKLSRADPWKIELFLKSMVAPMTGEPSPSIASQLGTKLRAAESHASQGKNAEARALYQEVVKAAPGTPQGMEARFRIDAMVPEGAGEPH